MYKRTFGIGIFLLILGIAIFHNVAMARYLYWRYSWSDSVVHFFAGIWVALSFYWFYRFWFQTKKIKFSLKEILFMTLGSALTVGALWEIFEYMTGIVVYSSKYIPDTISDLCMDIVGGIIGYFIVVGYQTYIDKQKI